MKKCLAILICVTVGATAFADSSQPAKKMARTREQSYLSKQIASVTSQMSSQKIGDLTFGELQNILGTLSVARQKDLYVRKSSAASAMLPGLGQLLNHDTGSGILFLTAYTAVEAGTLLGSYFLLPGPLKFGQLDYFHAPFSSIKTAWESQNVVNLLPSAAVLAGGVVLQVVLHAIAARNARDLARERIDSGAVTFKPQVVAGADGMLGVGIAMMMGK